jgi:hypothetical protein
MRRGGPAANTNPAVDRWLDEAGHPLDVTIRRAREMARRHPVGPAAVRDATVLSVASAGERLNARDGARTARGAGWILAV